MQMVHKMVSTLKIPQHYCLLFLLLLLLFNGVCSSTSSSTYEHLNLSSTHRSIYHNIKDNKVISPQMTKDITIHGLLLWLSMGLLMPIGILTIRVSNKEQNGRWKKVFFYIHVILQILAALLATAGAIMSIIKFENSFNNNHQRLGLALYASIWVQTFLGFLRPPRGRKWRSRWYFMHWMLGTTISLVGIFNTYTGLKAYHMKTSKGVGLWSILFTAEVSFIGFFYLFQDKWEYMQKQGVILGTTTQHDLSITPTIHQETTILNPNHHHQKMLPQPCDKHNALKNLFD